MGETIDCSIDEVKLKDQNFLSPIIVTFQNGELLPKKAKTLKCNVFINKKRQTRHFELESGLNNVSYVGASGKDVNENTCKTMLAIRNRKTNKIRLVESDTIIFAPCFKREKKEAKDLNLTFDAKMQNLSRTFGSKKGRRMNEQREKSKSVQITLTEETQEKIQAVDVSVMESAEDCAPGGIPWKRDAERPEDVYKLHDLVSKEMLKSLKLEARTVKNTPVDSLKSQYSSFLVENVSLILEKNAANKPQLKKDLELLVYIDYLIMHARYNTGKPFAAHEKLCKSSKLVNDKLIQEFSAPFQNNTRVCTTSLKNKAACHVIVLALLLFDFQVSLQQLATALDHTVDKLKVFSHALGVVSVKDSTVSTLRAPIPVRIERHRKTPNRRR